MTLVEMLVAIAIIGLLVALLLPALQMAREAMRRVTCGQHLKQQVLAIHHYHTTHRQLPFGAYAGWGHDFHTALLPFLDQPVLADSIPWTETGAWSSSDPHSAPFLHASRVSPPYIRCPTERAPRIENRRVNGITGRAVSSYNANGGSDVVRGDNLYKTDRDFADGNGPFQVWPMRNRNHIRLRFTSIHDGLTHTAFLGEVRYRLDDVCGVCDRFAHYHPNFDSLQGFDFSEALSSMAVKPITGGWSRERDVSQTEAELAMGSWHPQGLNLAMGDGSVRFVNESIDLAAWQALGSRAARDERGTQR